MLRIYTDPLLGRPDWPLVPMIHGMLRDVSAEHSGTTWERRFVPWWDVADTHISLVPLADADLAVLPFDWYRVRGESWNSRTDREMRATARAFADDVRAAGKSLAVFWTADRSNEPLRLPASVVVREGPYRTRFSSRDVVMPGFHEDLVVEMLDGNVPVREKGPEPIVGFCGLAGQRNSLKHRAKLVAYHARNLATQRWIDVSPYKGEVLRSAAIDLLSRAPGVQTNFVVRDRGVFFVDAPATSLVDVRREYVQNAVASDYLLVCRGSGNCFTRLYEAMCLGRIPVFIDTDCVLPWEDRIDWRKSCVFLDESELPNIGAKVRDFHDSISPDDFRTMQHRNRQLWLEHLSPRGFFSTLAEQWATRAAYPISKP
jgi:hypothetical protein